MSHKDMIVDLYDKRIQKPELKYEIKRVLSPDSDKVLEFIESNFSRGWVSESKAALYKANPSCFIAVDDQKMIGFACYDATAKGYFGPTGVDQAYRGQGIGKALLLTALESMRHDGYGYAIIGAVSEENKAFYENGCGAIPIENSAKIYERMIK